MEEITPIDLTVIENNLVEIIDLNTELISKLNYLVDIQVELIKTNVMLKWCFGISVLSLVLLISIFLGVYLSNLK